MLKAIYKDVFCNTFNQSCYVFLCGGGEKEHIRNKVNALLKKEQFQILYPEELFMEMLNRDKKSDLLEYENLLADNSDIICIICESIGSAVELGAFIQNENIKKKMVVAVNQKYARDKSFVMMGPVKNLKKTNEESIVFFKKDDLSELCRSLSKVFRKLHKKSVSNKNQSFDNLSAYIAFIPMVVYFYQTISRRTLHKNLKIFLKEREQDCFPARYNELFNASIKYLIKSGTLITEFSIEEKDETLSLSLKGYEETLGQIKRSSTSNRIPSIFNIRKKRRLSATNRIRCAILKEQLNM